VEPCGEYLPPQFDEANSQVLFNRLLFASGFANVVVFLVVTVNYDWQHALVLAPLLPVLIAFKVYCFKRFDPLFDYYIPDEQNIDAERAPVTVHQDTNRDKLKNRFGHPAWTRQLITPMVHKKAHHLLATVYHGRMHGDENQSYSSNSRQNGSGIGKVELVAEHDLDYENFKVSPPPTSYDRKVLTSQNRPDFDTASLMDNSTVAGDNASIFSVPLKDSRPATPSQQSLNSRVPPGYASRTDLPLRTGSPLRPADDYFTRTPSRGAYREMTPEYTAGYTPSDVYEMSALSTYDSREPSDSAALLREPSGTPPPRSGGRYV
jgi:hypothetical protein